MRTLKKTAVALALVAAAACGAEKPHGKNAASTDVKVTTPSVAGDVAPMGSTYRDAYELAKKEITKDNAADELDRIEHDVNKDM